MRVLLDENLPRDLVDALSGYDVLTVQALGWAGVKNGELLRRASDRIDAFLTMDRNLEHQQIVTTLSFGVIVIRARSNRVADLLPLVPGVIAALAAVQAGKVQHVGG